MLKIILQQLRTSLMMLFIFTILTGMIYPGIVTAIAQLLFPWQANGSLIEVNNKPIASQLIGQHFTDASYFWGRPSATKPFPYNSASSSGSNMGPSNPVFINTVADRINKILLSGPHPMQLIPIDLITASASGLDPDISPLAAFYQVERIAKVRNLPANQIHDLIQKNIHTSFFGLLGAPHVNVLQLNLALDNLRNETHVRAAS